MGDVVKTEIITCMFDMDSNADVCKASDSHRPHKPTHVFENINRYSFDRLGVSIDEHGVVSARNNDYHNFEVSFACEKIYPKKDEVTGEIMFQLDCRVRER